MGGITQLHAQSYLEFVENKGQWDKQIKYKGDLGDGAFAIKADGGYRMLVYNGEDLAAINRHKHNATASSTIQRTALSDQSLEGDHGGTGGGSGASGSRIQQLRGHVYEVSFLNANPSPQAVPDKAIQTVNNYFIGNDPNKWVSNCKVFTAVTYKNLYNNIDIRYYSSNGQIKYEFIVHPGGNPENIAMYIDGATGIKMSGRNLQIKTSVKDIVEQEPVSFQLTNDGRKPIASGFQLKGNIVRFQIADPINKKQTLVIDPLIFSTFSGSTASNWGFTATYDNKGNFYAGGTVFGDGFPVSNGAYNSSFGGGATNGGLTGYDMGIIKFDPTGANRIYATYIGGRTGSDQPHSMVVDAQGNIVIAGRTTSTDYPNTYTRMGPGGATDIVITKLNSNGTALIGSRIIGGNADDGVNVKAKIISTGYGLSIDRNYGDDGRSEVILDEAGNIYLSSCTQSVNFPVLNAAQPNNGGRSTANGRAQDGVVMKFSPTLATPIFSTYLGGAEDDAAFVLALKPDNGDLYVAGATASSDFFGDKSGMYQSSFQGGICDGFVAIYDNNGVSKKTSYFGTNGIDVIYGIQFDKFNFPYIMGTTTGNIPVQNAVFSQAGGKQFITKFNADVNTVIFSTNFGTNASVPNISPTAFLIDRCENIYVSGWGGLGNTEGGYPASAGTRGLVVTPDAVLGTTDGSDFYFIVLEKNANSLKYGSFFGQNGGGYPDHVDGGTSRFDRNGIIYQSVCANCAGGARFPTSAGVWGPNNNALNAATGGGCNLAAIKIAFNLAGVGSDLVASIKGRPRDTSGCVPLSVDFEDSLAMGQLYIWDYNDGSKRDTTRIPKTTHVFNNIGVYRVKLISIDSSACNIADSSYVNLRVRNDEAILGFTAAKQPPCASLSYLFTNTSSPPVTVPAKPFKANSFLWIFGDGNTQTTGTQAVTHTYATAGTYDVKLVLTDTNYCNHSDTVTMQIRISPNVKAQFTTPAVGCAPYNALFNNTSLAGTDFLWDFGDGTTSTQTSPSHFYPTVGTYQVVLIANDTNTCNKTDTTRFTLTVSNKPTAFYSYSPQPTEPNTAVSFTNSSIGAVRYKWLFGDGDSVITTRIDTTIRHIYPATNTYNACLIAFNAGGCSDTTCQSIPVTINPIMDVPNAFSPNGDGKNDRIYVRGFGIEQMTWRIYDRWGNQVFATADPNEGWDGTFNGRLLAQDVYHYTVQIVFSSKEKLVKKGDITLLR
jgi:gliding motility-associated-like protein